MVYLYYLQKMEAIKIRKRGKTIPFGFKESTEAGYLEPIREELDALKQAREYLKTCSLRETANWLQRKTGRRISHVGLRQRINSTSKTEEATTEEKAES